MKGQKSSKLKNNSNKWKSLKISLENSLNLKKLCVKTAVGSCTNITIARQSKRVNFVRSKDVVERKLKKKDTYSRTTCSYPCLIGLALKTALIGHMFIRKIFEFVCTHYFPYFRNSTEIIILETKHVISDVKRGTHRRG